jgi:alcohol dehydrogenase
MDTAKCANVLAMNGGTLAEYEDGVEEPRHIERLLPHIAIPTTAGTGSEATVWAVFIDPATKRKTAVQDQRLIADVAILDPEVTTTVPPAVTAGTGMDALTHAIEAFVSIHASPLTDALAVEAIGLIARNLRQAVADGADLDARMNMLTASFMAGAAFSNLSCGLVHTLSEVIGGLLRTPHGVTNAILLPWVMEFNLDSRRERFAKVAAVMGQETRDLDLDRASRAAVSVVRSLADDIGLPQSLREIGVQAKDLPQLAGLAIGDADSSGNPESATEQQLVGIYKEAY